MKNEKPPRQPTIQICKPANAGGYTPQGDPNSICRQIDAIAHLGGTWMMSGPTGKGKQRRKR